ncbi:hypothetical protein Tco_1456032 [Tanacetum coccineum]
MERYKAEFLDVEGAPECMRISGFMHGITHPGLIKRLYERIPRSMDKMYRMTTSFLQGEVAALSHGRRKASSSWKPSEGGDKPTFKKGFKNKQRPDRKPDRFSLLTKTPKEIFALEKGKFKAPPPMVTPVEKRDPSKYCEFHSDTGHNTNECMQLRKQIDEMIKAGKLSQFIKELKQNDKTKAPKKGEASGKDKPLTILMIQPWERVAKPRITQSFSPETAMSFPPLSEEDGTESPMIIEVEMGGHFVHRVYVDGGASSEVLYEHCFVKLRKEIRDQMVPATTHLIGFSGETIWPLGLWYSRDSPFELVAYTDSDYAGATLDRKSTTGGCQFLGNRLISWQCKKQTVVATSTTEAEYVAAASCCGQVGNEAVHKELGDRMERAATTASSLEADGPRWQDTIVGDVNAQTRFEITSIQSIDPPLSRGYTLGSGEDSMKLIGIDEILLKLVLFVLVSAVKHMLMLPVQVSAVEVNPEIYTSCIEQFWATAKVQIVNGVRQVQALVDKKRVIVMESSIRRDLHLDDAEGTDCLPNATIFEELARMGAKSTAWNEFSSSMASLIICLATNQKFNLSKYIFDAMVKHLDGGVKFLLYLLFLQRARKDFSRRITPLFDTMMVQPVEEMGKDSDHPTDSTPIPIIDQPSSSSKPKKDKSSKKAQR